MKKMLELNDTNFESEVLKAAGPVLVDFYASWCGPCKMLAPVLEQLAVEFAGRMKFVKLNVDDAMDISQRYGITGVPTLMVFRGGMPAEQMAGLTSPKQLKQWLEKAANETAIA